MTSFAGSAIGLAATTVTPLAGPRLAGAATKAESTRCLTYEYALKCEKVFCRLPIFTFATDPSAGWLRNPVNYTGCRSRHQPFSPSEGA